MEDNVFSHGLFRGMLYTIGALLVIFLVLTIVVKAHDASQIAKNNIFPPKTIMISGDGKVLAKPDIAFVNFDLAIEGDSVAKVEEAYQEKIKDFLNALKGVGIDQSRVLPTNFSVIKDQKYKGTVTLQIKIEDEKTIDDSIAKVHGLAIKHGMTVSSGYNTCPGFSDPEEYLPEARGKAIAAATKKAKSLAAITGLALGKIVSVTDNNYGSMPYGAQISCGIPLPGIPVAPQELTVSVSLTFEVN